MTMLTALLVVVLGYVVAVLGGHVSHELAHLLVARLSSARDVRFVWPKLFYNASPRTAFAISIAPLCLAALVLVGWVVLVGQVWLSIGGVLLPHPVWLYIAVVGIGGGADVGVLWQAGRQLFARRRSW